MADVNPWVFSGALAEATMLSLPARQRGSRSHRQMVVPKSCSLFENSSLNLN